RYGPVPGFGRGPEICRPVDDPWLRRVRLHRFHDHAPAGRDDCRRAGGRVVQPLCAHLLGRVCRVSVWLELLGPLHSGRHVRIDRRGQIRPVLVAGDPCVGFGCGLRQQPVGPGRFLPPRRERIGDGAGVYHVLLRRPGNARLYRSGSRSAADHHSEGNQSGRAGVAHVAGGRHPGDQLGNDQLFPPQIPSAHDPHRSASPFQSTVVPLWQLPLSGVRGTDSGHHAVDSGNPCLGLRHSGMGGGDVGVLRGQEQTPGPERVNGPAHLDHQIMRKPLPAWQRFFRTQGFHADHFQQHPLAGQRRRADRHPCSGCGWSERQQSLQRRAPAVRHQCLVAAAVL
nr:hypothetical protein [Tanacetum cinerariifolium]